jgi:hypothetical protein
MTGARRAIPSSSMAESPPNNAADSEAAIRAARSMAVRRGRIRGRARCVAAATMLALLALPSLSRAQLEPDHVLLMGNSFMRGVGSPLRKLFDENRGVRLRVVTSARSGYTLAAHLASSKTSRNLYRYDWDWVVAQEQSDGIDEDRYPYARTLDALVALAGSRLMFFMTWRDRGDPLADFDSLRGVVGGTEGYVPIAEELGAPIAPVGWAVREGVRLNVPVDFWSRDGHHLSKQGRYLAACVLYAALTGESPVGGWAPGKYLEDGSAALLQQLAADTVLATPEDWFLDP